MGGKTSCIKCNAGKYRNSNAASSVEAIACTDCDSGSHQHEQGKTSCMQCAAGRYRNDELASTDANVACNDCADTKYQPASGQLACAKCATGKFRETSQPASSAEVDACTSLYNCDNSEYQSTPPTVTSDRTCSQRACLCTNGVGSQGAACPHASAGQYHHCATCHVGFHLENNQCVPNLCHCNNGTSKTGTACTTHLDHHCHTCKTGYHFSGNGKTCVKHTECNFPTTDYTAGEWMKADGDMYTDRDCEPLDECDYSVQYESSSPTETSNRVCADLATCHDNQYITANATHTSNRVCANHRMCNEYEFMTLDGALNWNRRCEDLDVCEGHEYELAAPKASSVVGAHWVSDRDCRAHGDCNENQYESEAPTATSDRGCSLIRSCVAGEYQTAAPTKTSNRVCAPLRTCASNEFQTVEPTTTSNRVRQTHKDECESNEFESTSPDGFTDRECTPHATPCTSTQWQSQAPGTHQNRVCKDCIAEPACPWNQYRLGCGGTSPGECVYDCDPKYQCFVGHSGTSWFLAVTQWSKHVFPAYPHLVRVGGGITESEVTLSAPSGHAAKGVIVTKNGKISVRRSGGGKLQISEA